VAKYLVARLRWLRADCVRRGSSLNASVRYVYSRFCAGLRMDGVHGYRRQYLPTLLMSQMWKGVLRQMVVLQRLRTAMRPLWPTKVW